MSNTSDRNSLAANGAGSDSRVWASETVFHGAVSSLKAKKVGGVDKKVETILGDQLSQLALNGGDLWNGRHSKYKPRESWGCGGLISPLGLTSKMRRRLLKGEGDVFRALSGAQEGREPSSFHLLLPGHISTIES